MTRQGSEIDRLPHPLYGNPGVQWRAELQLLRSS